MDLALISAGIVAFALFMYVLLDGFDLGIGILFLVDRDRPDRDEMMTAIEPFWDGNETWLVFGGVALFGGFPIAYAILLPALYLPVMAMLFALVFRGVAFEYRAKSQASRRWWDLSFSVGAGIAAFAQGVMLGAVLNGITVVGHSFAGRPFDWLTPFSVICGLGLIAGYALLGATWLVMKAEEPLQSWARQIAIRLVPVLALFLVLLSLWTPLEHPIVARRWLTLPNILYLAPLPLAAAAALVGLFRSLARGDTRKPFLLTIVVFAFSLAGLGTSLFPYVIPFGTTIWDAAAPPPSQKFMLMGIAVMLPVVIAYTGYNYWVFRGKLGKNTAYD
jgi:cytochrome bd ubiquinol oxidase subunit II